MHGWWVSRDGKAMTYWGGGNYTLYMCLWGLIDHVHIRAMATSSRPTSKASEKRPEDEAGAMDVIVT